MASPQKEKGYTAIANELMEKIAGAGFNGVQLALVLAVLRLTYGYQRKTATVCYSQLASITGRGKGTVVKEMKRLAAQGVLIRDMAGGPNRPSVWGVNRDWESWATRVNCTPNGLYPKRVTGQEDCTPNGAQTCTTNGVQGVPQTDHSHLIKKTLKEKKKLSPESEENTTKGDPDKFTNWVIKGAAGIGVAVSILDAERWADRFCQEFTPNEIPDRIQEFFARAGPLVKPMKSPTAMLKNLIRSNLKQFLEEQRKEESGALEVRDGKITSGPYAGLPMLEI